MSSIDLAPIPFLPYDASTQSYKFIFDNEDSWVVQRYIGSVAKISITDAGKQRYPELATFFETYAQHVHGWTEIQNGIVTIASNISSYAGTFKSYATELQNYSDGKGNNTVDDVQGMLGDLADTATRYQKSAKPLYDKATSFVTLVHGDGAQIESLLTKYSASLDADKASAAATTEKIKEHAAEIEKQNKIYEKAVRAVSLTPAYAWFFPGILVALIVAGVSDKKATDALKAIEEHKEAIEQLTATLQGLQSDIVFIETQTTTLREFSGLGSPLSTVVAELGKIPDGWTTIITKLQQAQGQTITPAEVKTWNLANVSVNWQTTKAESDKFRLNAYIKIQ